MKLSDQIRIRIESAIASGELLPGDAIDDVALARQYKVSRTPVREALLQFQAQGILARHTQRRLDGGQNEFAAIAFIVGVAG
jgi:DNA-binding GntR family transcriptional regulator